MSHGHAEGHREWLMERLSALLLLGLLPWLWLDLPSLETLSREALITWLRQPLRLPGLILLLGVTAWHAGLGAGSILTDYLAQGRIRALSMLLVRLLLVLSAVAGLASSLLLYGAPTP